MVSRTAVAAHVDYSIRKFFSRFGGAPVLTAYWYRREKNFGDLLTPLILQAYGVTPVWAPAETAQLSFIGSILEHLPEHFSGTVLGSGFISADSKVNTLKSSVLGVRGHLSASKFSPPCKAIGDPALLLRRVWVNRPAKKYKLGVVPHYVHLPNTRSQRNFLSDALVIDPQRTPMEVIKDISSCENIVSSSLHGIIVADALDIPNKWAVADGLLGGQFKFRDYFSMLDHEETPIDLFASIDADDVVAQCRPKIPGRVDNVVDILDSVLREYLAHEVNTPRGVFVSR